MAAISCLKRATYLSPFEWKILYNLGLVHLAMQQYASAFRYLNSAINYRPKEAIIYSLMAVALTNLDDPANAKEAYEHSLSLDKENIYTNLNYAVFLYNQGDRQGSANRLTNFRKYFESIVQGKSKDIDPELQEISAKLGPILSLGELARPKASLDTEAESKSSQKYATISNATDETGDSYKREASVASVSNVGMNKENQRAFTPHMAGPNKDYEASMRKNFENN